MSIDSDNYDAAIAKQAEHLRQLVKQAIFVLQSVENDVGASPVETYQSIRGGIRAALKLLEAHDDLG